MYQTQHNFMIFNFSTVGPPYSLQFYSNEHQILWFWREKTTSSDIGGYFLLDLRISFCTYLFTCHFFLGTNTQIPYEITYKLTNYLAMQCQVGIYCKISNLLTINHQNSPIWIAFYKRPCTMTIINSKSVRSTVSENP